MPEVTLRLGPPLLWWRLVRGDLVRPVGWHPQYPMRETLVAAAMSIEAWAATDEPGRTREDVWGLYQIVVDGLVVGDAGFHGSPAGYSPRQVEIGYGVVPARRREGIAGRACAALLDIAWSAGADSVRADTAPGNEASRRVLLSHGFRPDTGGGYVVDRPRNPT